MFLIDTMSELMAAGGAVMWPLAIVSFYIWYILAYRWLQLTGHRFCNSETLGKIATRLRDGESVKSAPELQYAKGIQKELILELDGSSGVNIGRRLDEIIRAVQCTIRKETNVIRCLINAAPLLGLLGTVCGMIETFNVLQIAGTSDPRLLARGISLAMITTQAGLLIAVPALFLEQRVHRREEYILLKLEESEMILRQELTV